MAGAEALHAVARAPALGLHPAPLVAVVRGGAGKALLRDRAPALLAGKRHRPRLDGPPVDRLRVGENVGQVAEDLDRLLGGLLVAPGAISCSAAVAGGVTLTCWSPLRPPGVAAVPPRPSAVLSAAPSAELAGLAAGTPPFSLSVRRAGGAVRPAWRCKLWRKR